MVSFRLSPLRMLVLAASEKPITLAPSLFAAVSKLRRVLRLEEDTRHHLVAQEGLRLVVLKLLRHVEDVQDLLLGEILD